MTLQRKKITRGIGFVFLATFTIFRYDLKCVRLVFFPVSCDFPALLFVFTFYPNMNKCNIKINLVNFSLKNECNIGVINRVKSRDKSDRATSEQVMDPRTRMMLFKMINRHLIAEVNGCISTGKEANVYHACRADGTEHAIKVWSMPLIITLDNKTYRYDGHQIWSLISATLYII